MENCTVISSISPTFLAINRNHSTSAKKACLKMWQRELSSSKISTFRAMSKPARTPKTETHAGANEAKPSERNRNREDPSKTRWDLVLVYVLVYHVKSVKNEPLIIHHYSMLFHQTYATTRVLAFGTPVRQLFHRSESVDPAPRSAPLPMVSS